MNDKEVEVKETAAVEPYQSASLGGLAIPMAQIIDRASEVATNLATIIKDKQLYTMIERKAYVHVEGWTTMGALIGILPKVREVKKHPGGYEAIVDLVRARDGVIVGGASAICTTDEKGKDKFKAYALYSMAETRATGKAYRLAFSWIMKLAGYEPTPWEEMEDVIDVIDKEAPPESPDGKLFQEEGEGKAASWPIEDVERLENSLIKNKLVPADIHRKHTIMFLNLMPFGSDVKLMPMLGWARIYRKYRNEFTPKVAASRATRDWFEANPEEVKP